MKSAVIVFPGSNREQDIADAIERSTGKQPFHIWHRDTELPDVDLIVLPGGFSYGDYLRTGAIAARSPIMSEVKRRADRGTPVIGVCNGFQILCEAGLLPGVLLMNASLKFICRNVNLKVETSQSLFTQRYATGQVLSVPVAHHEGNYFADPATLDRIEDKGQVTAASNCNGSARNIAGIFNDTKNVLGLMPHPENATDPMLGSTDGRALFDAMAEVVA